MTRRVCTRCGRALSEKTGFIYSHYTRSYYCASTRWRACDRAHRRAALDENQEQPKGALDPRSPAPPWFSSSAVIGGGSKLESTLPHGAVSLEAKAGEPRPTNPLLGARPPFGRCLPALHQFDLR